MPATIQFRIFCLPVIYLLSQTLEYAKLVFIPCFIWMWNLSFHPKNRIHWTKFYSLIWTSDSEVKWNKQWGNKIRVKTIAWEASPLIFRTIISRSEIYVEHVTFMRAKCTQNFRWKTWSDNEAQIRAYCWNTFWETRRDYLNWVQLTLDMNECWPFVNMVNK
jgi:hypothetical protein